MTAAAMNREQTAAFGRCRQRQVAGSCERGNEPLGAIKRGEFLE